MIMNHTDEVKQVLYDYVTAGLVDYDLEKVLSCLSDDIIGIGLGEQGFVSSKEDVAKVLTDSIKKNTQTVYSIDYENILVNFTDESHANLCAEIQVNCTENNKTSTSGFLQSLNLAFDAGRWIIHQVHASPVMVSKESISAYPLSFADKTLADLRSELQQDTFDLINKNFSGGIFGAYMTGSFPLYFANDLFCEQLGYTHDEFYETFGDDATKVIYEQDLDRIISEVYDYLEKGVREYELKIRLKTKSGGFIWVIEHARKTEDSNGVSVLLAVTTDITDMVELQEKLEEQNSMTLSGLRYASKIQHDLLPSDKRFAQAFSDYSVLWKPRDIVGGDIYGIKNFQDGTVLGICDCTGHGTPGALLTMLISSIFNNIVSAKNRCDTALLMLELDRRISADLNVHSENPNEGTELTAIHDGCDAAILFVAKDGTVTFSSAGIHVFICDGKEVTQLKGQRLHIGNGILTDKKQVVVTKIPANYNNKFYIASDGLFDQIGGKLEQPFGYKRFKEIILKNHSQNLSDISAKIWTEFEEYSCNYRRRDDVELITFKP